MTIAVLSMPLHKTRAVVIGRRAFGESDRLVDFYTREHGKVRGIARAARRPGSRFGSALELFTLGEMVFFDGGRSELVQVDHLKAWWRGSWAAIRCPRASSPRRAARCRWCPSPLRRARDPSSSPL